MGRATVGVAKTGSGGWTEERADSGRWGRSSVRFLGDTGKEAQLVRRCRWT